MPYISATAEIMYAPFDLRFVGMEWRRLRDHFYFTSVDAQQLADRLHGLIISEEISRQLQLAIRCRFHPQVKVNLPLVLANSPLRKLRMRLFQNTVERVPVTSQHTY